MSDLSTRARALAVKEGLILDQSFGIATKPIFNINRALAEIGLAAAQRGRNAVVAKEWAEVLFNVTVLSSLMGIDVVDGILAAIEQREISGKKIVPGTKAPVPNAKTNDGMMRDPGTGQEPWPDEA